MKPAIAVAGFPSRGGEPKARRCDAEQNPKIGARCDLRCCGAAECRVNQAKRKPMDSNRIDHNRPVFDHLHPNLYAPAVGLVAWFVLAAWVLFDHRLGQPSEVSLQR
jgi:hypothetical protein